MSPLLAIALALCLLLAPALPARAADLPFLQARGARIVDDAGRPVILRGCNLGNWLILEPWMFPWAGMKDQAQIAAILRERFGAAEADSLFDLWRAGYITARDFQLVKVFGFNVVRLPLDYRLLQDDQPPYALRRDAFRWLDRALDLAQTAGLYVIVDLHGAPGGQSREHHTGQAGQNRLWSSPEDRRRTVEVWRQLARHCADRSVVAAYDLLNEPYGDYRQDLRADLVSLGDQLYRAVRESDRRHLIFFAGALHAQLRFYGRPADRAWQNVGFTEHFYPGLFGDTPALESHARILNYLFQDRRAWLEAAGAPYLLGEFNVVLGQAGGDRLFRHYYDRAAAHGWAATMWSYKILKTAGGVGPDNWYLVTNAQPLPRIDLRTIALADLRRTLESLATMELAVDEPLRTALTAQKADPIPLPQFPAPLAAAPADTPPAGWQAADLGDAPRGGVRADAAGAMTIWGGGPDIYGTHDAFRFVHQPATGDTSLAAEVISLTDTHRYAKAGLMLRAALEPDAAFALANTFPDGALAFCWRLQRGAPVQERKVYPAASPVQLRLERRGAQVTAAYGRAGAWQPLGTADLDLGPRYHAGLAVCSHDREFLAEARFTTIARPAPAAPASAPPRPTAASLLRNGSFETAGARPDRAADWNTWGDWLNREAAWKPVRTGQCLLGYHHWRIEKAGDSGLWQDLTVEPGQYYTFRLRASRDEVTNQRLPEQLELRLEAALDGRQVTVASRTYSPADLATGDAWSELSVRGLAPASTLRVLLRVQAARETLRGGALKFDDAELTRE